MRRAVRHSLTTAMLAGLAVLGCRESGGCSRCGTLVAVVTTDADVLVPAFSETSVGQQVGDLLFLKLADLGLGLNTLGDSGFIPRLARGWTFEDPLTLAFTLDPRARWDDGLPVTADDVAFTFAIYRDAKAASPSRPLLGEIESVTARDPYTAVFRFKRQYAEQFYDATHHMRILPRHLLDSIPRERLAAHPFGRRPVGDGPYRLVRWTSGESIELAADSGFFLGKPGLDRLIWRITPDYPTAITQLASGDADFMEYLGSPENVTRIATVPALRIIKYTSPAYMYLGFNLRDPENPTRANPLFGDRDLRRALTLVIDQKTIARAVLGEYASPAIGPVSRLTPIGNDTTLPQLGFDTTEAAMALDRLGWKRGPDGIRARAGHRLRFEVLVPGSSQVRNRIAVILQDQFKRAGVDARITVVEFNLFTNRTRAGNFETAMLTWNDDPTPSSLRQTWLSSAIGDANFVGYANPVFDREVNEAWMADPSTAPKRWRQALSTLIEDAPGIWIANPIQPAGIHRRYENVTIRPDQWTATLWTWRVTPGSELDRDRITASPQH